MTQGLYDLPTMMAKYWWIIPIYFIIGIIIIWLYERRKQRLAQKEETEKER
jgi:type II secretory pathway component PulF